jgi:hypothetical protein
MVKESPAARCQLKSDVAFLMTRKIPCCIASVDTPCFLFVVRRHRVPYPYP